MLRSCGQKKRKKILAQTALVFCSAFFCCSLLAQASDKLSATEKELTIEEFLQQLSSVPSVLVRRDPFTKSMAPFEGMKSDSDQAKSASVLERYPLRDYQIVAILLGDVYSRALVRVPEGNRVMIVREKDKLGNRGGVIKKILSNLLVIEENKKNDAGFVDRAEVQLAIQASSLDGAASKNMGNANAPKGK